MVITIAITASGSYSRRAQFEMQLGQQVSFAGHTFVFESVDFVTTASRSEKQAVILVDGESRSVAQSEVPASRDIRADIARRITLGESDDQIRQEMASRFGPDILLSPSHDGIVGLVWIIPILMLAAVAAGLVLAFRRWRTVASGIVTDADRALIAKAFERLEAGHLDQVDLRG